MQQRTKFLQVSLVRAFYPARFQVTLVPFAALEASLVTEITCWVEVVVNCARFCLTGRHFKSFPKETTKKKTNENRNKRKMN